jgi:hypothetical protein
MILLLAAAGAAGFVVWFQFAPLWADRRSAQAGHESKAKFTAPGALASVASVAAEWNVFDKETGTRLARAYIANERISRTARVPLVEGAPATLPVFVLAANRRIEPLLVPVGTPHTGQAVGGKWASKGVFVAETGAVLTAAPSQRPWNTTWHWIAEEPAGALLVLESLKIKQVVPLAAAQFPRWVPAESGFFAEGLPANLEGDLRGRLVSRSDLRVDVTADIGASGRMLKAKVTAESSGIWLASVQPGMALAGSRVPPLDDGTSRPKNRQQVWVIGDKIEAGEIRSAPADGLMELRTSRCGEGGVVFDQEGRVLGLCVPDAQSETGAGIAVPIRLGLVLLGGAPDDKTWQP